MKPRLLLVALVALVCTAAAAVVASAGTGRSHDRHHRSSYEVWLVDQEDKGSLGAGTLHIFDGRELARDAASAVPETISLASDVETMCKEKTGTRLSVRTCSFSTAATTTARAATPTRL